MTPVEKIMAKNKIYSVVGFDELEFKVLKHLRNNHFTSEPIDTTNIKDFYDDVKKLVKFARKNKFTKSIEIDNLIENRARLNSYKSETFEKFGVKYQESQTYYEKWLEQRIRNTGLDKTMDNFRYMILRSHDVASTNQYPFGIDINSDKFTMGAFDRSNLTEFEISNCLAFLNPQDMNISSEDYNKLKLECKKDSLKKQNITDVINNIKEDYPDTYPTELDIFLKTIENDGASTTYLISDVLSTECINNVLDRHNACRILIGHREIISKELENLNNKNNPWQQINFLFQSLNSKTHLKFVDEAISALERDDYEDCIDYHKNLKEIAPEYILLPVIVENIFKPSDFKPTRNDSIENFERLANLLEGKDFHTNKDKWVLEKYKSITEIPAFKYSLVNDFYSFDSMEVWKKYDTKLFELKKVIKKLKTANKASHPKHDEILTIALSSIDGLRSVKFGYNVYATLASKFAGDGKTIKNSPDNVVKAIELLLDTYFGDDVFTVDLSKNEYNIKDQEFLNVIMDKDQGGYATSHSGRGEYFVSSKLQDYKQKYQDFEDYRGTNDELVDNQIKLIDKLLGVTRFGWYEDTTSGKVVYCGWDKGVKDNTSWEHIDNTTQKVGAIRATETNSGDGAKTKAFKTTSEYFEYIIDQQDSPKVDKYYNDDLEKMIVKFQLGKIVKHFKDEESK